MQKFTGIEYLYIDIANCYGLNHLTWLNRIKWTKTNINNLYDYVKTAKEPFLLIKAIHALKQTQLGHPQGHNMFLDATSSGLSIMACLTGCTKTATRVNLINTGNREDVYLYIASKMNSLLVNNRLITKKIVKLPLMTHYYNKVNLDEYLNYQEIMIFDQVIQGVFPGPESLITLVNQYWDNTANEHSWIMPDNHVVKIKTLKTIDLKIEIDELNHTTFTHRCKINTPINSTSSLLPNIVHSIDAYIAREMLRKTNILNIQLAHIHDSFTTHPNYMQHVREIYVQILAKIADSNLLANILSTISGKNVSIIKLSNNLSYNILQADYALS